MENLKTLGTMLQNIIEEDGKYYNLIEFLADSTAEDRKKYSDKLVDADYKQFYEYMDGIHFVNEEEIYCAVSEYYEKVMNRPLSMGECGDMSEIADYYIREKNLNFDDDEE